MNVPARRTEDIAHDDPDHDTDHEEGTVAHVWVLYDSGAHTTQLFRADAIEELHGTSDQLNALLTGSGGQMSNLLHISGCE